MTTEEKRAYDIAWKAANRERVKAHNAAYYAKHKEQCKASVTAYMKVRPELKSKINKRYNESEKGKAAMAQWQAKNREVRSVKQSERRKTLLLEHPEYREIERERTRQRTLSGAMRAYDQSFAGKVRSAHARANRRARVRAGATKDARVAIQKILSQKRPKCFYCKRFLQSKEVTIDHIRPLAKGGKHAAFNLVAACGNCNHRKGAKDPNEFIESGQQVLVF